MPLTYHVVKFIEENTCEVIHDNWIINEVTSFWPNTQEEVIKYRIPGILKPDWSSVPISILTSTCDYSVAIRRCKRYEQFGTTDLESDCSGSSNLQKEKSRKRRKRKLSSDADEIGPSDDDDYSPDKSQANTCRKILFPNFKVPVFKDLKLTPAQKSQNYQIGTANMYESRVKSSKNDLTRSTVAAKSRAYVTKEQEATMTCDPSRSSAAAKSRAHATQEREATMTCGPFRSSGLVPVDSPKQDKQDVVLPHDENHNEADLMCYLKKMEERIHVQLQYMAKDIKDIRNNQLPIATDDDVGIYELLPIRTIDEFSSVEDRMNDVTTRKTLIRIIASKVVKQRDLVVGSCLKEILDDSFSSCCNFTGLHGKIGINKSWVFQILYGVLLKTNISLSRREIKEDIQLYLKRTVDSLTQKRRRAKLKAAKAVLDQRNIENLEDVDEIEDPDL